MERLIHYVWKYKLFPQSGLFTSSGTPLQILDPGIINRNTGPDFSHAKIKIGEVVWVGSVEVHNRASDWYSHSHGVDEAWDPVILHVIGEEDAVITRLTGEAIPQLVIAVPAHVRMNYERLKCAEGTPSCVSVLESLPKLKVHSWMSALVNERFEQKTRAIHQRLDRVEQDWEAAFFITLARNFGFGVNSDLFEQWAQSIPFRILGKHRDDLMQIEALFFGQSGLLKKEMPDEYSSRLQKEYLYLTHKFSLSSGDVMCKILRMRPNNFPHLRIAQLARLYYEKPFLFSRLMEAEELEPIFQILEIKMNGYWKDHLVFGRETITSERKMSLSSLRLIVINTVVPFLYAYGDYRGNEALKEKATRFLEQMPPEENYVIRSWRAVGIHTENAADTQALIQLSREYCEKRKCLFCRFGYEFLTRK